MADQQQPQAPQAPKLAPLTAAATAGITPPTAAPARDDKGNLTHQGMRDALARGGSVIHGGRIITNANDLPSEAELARGDEKAEAAARESLRLRREALDREESLLSGKSTPKK